VKELAPIHLSGKSPALETLYYEVFHQPQRFMLEYTRDVESECKHINLSRAEYAW